MCAREHAERFGPRLRALRARAGRGRGVWAEPPARAGVEAESERGWEAGVGLLPPPPPPPARLGWRQLEDCDLRRGASAMTAELQQDDAAGAADRLGSVGPATAIGAEGPGSAPRKGRGCRAGVGAARVAGGQAGRRACGCAGARREGAAEGTRGVRWRG